ncbi:MAG: Gfo/Idh/MocA family oxidoreductase, partial [Planctomycetes bacterium]|nr:Gfo/Idh/MocA family oxidoreductase [Planctomycetota bacterium]
MNRIGLGVVGMGSRGTFFGARHFMNYDSRAQVTAICDLNEQVLARAKEQLADIAPDVSCYTRLTDMLADDNVDAIINCTDDPNHFDTSVPVFASGKDLY